MQVQVDECGFDANCNLRGVDFDGATLEQAVMPGVDLRETKSMNRATLRDCVVSHTTRLPEGFPAVRPVGGAADILQKDSVLLISGNASGFSSALKDLGIKHGFHAVVVRNDWPRDHYSKRNIGSGQPLDVGIFSEMQIGPRERELMQHKFAFGVPPQTRKHGSNDRWKAVAAAPGISPVGGNMITTVGGCCIIGNNEVLYTDSEYGAPTSPFALLDEAIQKKVLRNFPGASDLDFAASAWLQRDAAKRELRGESLGATKVVILPQYMFHIDLQIAYLGGDVILVHSFEQTLNLLEKCGADYAEVHGQEALDRLKVETRSLRERYEFSVVEESVRRLEKAGLRPIKCCGALMSIPRANDGPDLVYSHFVNGVAIENEQGKMFFATADADGVSFHKRYFQELCGDLGVGVEFIRCNDARINPAAKILELNGGVRCRTFNPALTFFSRKADA